VNNIVGFNKKLKKEDPWGSNTIICMNCKHEWIGVFPIGTDIFECPECNTHKGLLKYQFLPEKGEIRECKCGNTLFYIQREGHFCPNCGIYQKY
jgi:rubredoxin